MRRLRAIATRLLLAASCFGAIAFLVGESTAELENQVFTSRGDRIRMIVPRGWRATDQPSYPGLLLWMMRTQPPGQIALSAEAFTRELYCSWPPECRAAIDTPTGKYACALRERLAAQKIRVGPAQLGPKENDAAGIPSMYFEYDDGKRFLRQAVAVTDERALSLVLSAPTNDARTQHTRAFDQALRTLQVLTVAEVTPPSDASTAVVVDADPSALVDGAVLDGGVSFESAPAARVNPIGPCR